MSAARRAELEHLWALAFEQYNYYSFARSTALAGEALIARLLKRMRKEQPRNHVSLFLRSAFDERAPVESWRAAVNALEAMESLYLWESEEKRDRLHEVAANGRLVSALQAVCVADEDPNVEYLAILAIDGEDASIDALIPHFDAARKDPTRLEQLLMIATYARDTPALRQLLAGAREQLEEFNSLGAVTRLAHQLRIANGSRFRVHVEGAATNKATFDLLLDSDGADDFRVGVFRKEKGTAFSAREVSRDELGVGRCELSELPQWLADRQSTLRTRWRPETIETAYLRGKRLKVFLDWLLGPSGIG